MNNLDIYNKLKTPPEDALKAIVGGRLKGKTDISPQWRIMAMTENFGICGIGWKYAITRQWSENGDNGQVFAFVNIELYIKNNSEWSEPIPGTGGTLLIVNEKSGAYSDDEAFKKSTTDALGYAMKFLGMGADIYMGKTNNGSKYPTTEPEKKQPLKQPKVESRALTQKEVEEKWNGKIYKEKYVYIDNVCIQPATEQIERLKTNLKYIK